MYYLAVDDTAYLSDVVKFNFNQDFIDKISRYMQHLNRMKYFCLRLAVSYFLEYFPDISFTVLVFPLHGNSWVWDVFILNTELPTGRPNVWFW